MLGHRIRRQLRFPEPNQEARDLLESLLAQPDVRAAMASAEPTPASEIVLPLSIEVGGQTLSWFSTIAAIGTPRDVTLEELSIESLFPANEATRHWAHEQVRGPAST